MSTSLVRPIHRDAGAAKADLTPKLRLLDRMIRVSHRLNIFGVHYHPYFLLSDIGLASLLVLSYRLSLRFAQPGLKLGAIMLTLMFLYEIFVKVRSRLLGIRSRSYLQDLLIFILPTFYLLVAIFHVNKACAFDLLGLSLPLYVGFCRVGCFLGGCCYGVPSRRGVSYPEEIFERMPGCRLYSPGRCPGIRVVPIQLVESAIQFAIFIVLLRWLWTEDLLRGDVLFLYLIIYAPSRFVLDFYRRESARPRWGRFSEAQVLCLLTMLVSAISLGWLAWQAGIPEAWHR